MGGLKTAEVVQGFRMANLIKNAEPYRPALNATLSVPATIEDVITFHVLAQVTGLPPSELFTRLLMRGLEEANGLEPVYPKLAAMPERKPSSFHAVNRR